MSSADYPRCENCGRPTTEESLTASAGFPDWIRGRYCPACVLDAERLIAEHPDGGDFLTPDE